MRQSCPNGLRAGRTTEEFAADLGLARGVSGYMYHTVPVAIYAWLRYPDDYRSVVQSAIRCGGDTDTVAAITGAVWSGARWEEPAFRRSGSAESSTGRVRYGG